MLRRGAAGRVGVVVGWVVVEDRAPANTTQTAQDTAQHGGEGFGVGHGWQRGLALASCQPRGGRDKSTAQGAALNGDAALIARLRFDGHTTDSLAATLGCARSMAADLLAGRRRWTAWQRAKLAKGAA